MEVLEMNEAYDEIDGCYGFTGTLVVYRRGSDIYHAVSAARYSSTTDVNAHDLANETLIPTAAYRPVFSPEFTRAPEPLPSACYIKRPRLISYDQSTKSRPNGIADSVLREVEVCELLRRSPHPHLATYLGCQVDADGRIAGLCFAKYDSTLMQKVNPGSLNKRALKASRAGSPREHEDDCQHVLEEVEEGLTHLHSLGLVHNDINPSNIMLEGKSSVIIDFGSCRRFGESLQGVGRTYEWYDAEVHSSVPENDWKALQEIRIWLGYDATEFQFSE